MTPPRRAIALLLVALAAMIGLAATALPLSAATSPPGGHPTLRIGGWAQLPDAAAAPATEQISLRFVLRGSDESGLDALVTDLYDPSSPDYHHFLTPGEFAARFGPSSAQVATVDRWAEHEGVRAVRDGRSLTLSGSVSRFDDALGTRIVRSGERFGTTSAPTLPADVAADVAAVAGQLPVPEPLGVAVGPVPHAPSRGAASSSAATTTASPSAGGPSPSPADTLSPCAGETNDGTGVDSFSSESSEYGTGTLLSNGDDGAGETIGVYEGAGFSMADIDQFAACMGVTPNVKVVQVDAYDCSTCGSTYTQLPNGGDGSLEAELDIEQLMAQAPDASIVVYESATNLPVWQAIVSGTTVNGTTVTMSSDGDVPSTTLGLGTPFPPPQVVSDSWGWYWQGQQSAVEGVQETLDPEFEQAATEGQSVFVASGDSDPSGSEEASTTVYPADSPWTTSVGGTVPQTSGPDEGWADSTGGYSPVEAEPAWQKLVETNSAYRGQPDVAADADFDLVYFTVGEGNDFLDVASVPSEKFSVSNSKGSCTTMSTSGGSTCTKAGPPTTTEGTTTASFSVSGYGTSNETIDADGAASTGITLAYSAEDSVLFAFVAPVEYTGTGYEAAGVDTGTVDFSDQAGDVTGCGSVSVEAGGLAICSGVDLAALASAGDTLTASYSGTGWGSSQTTTTVPASSSDTAFTSPSVDYDTSGTPAWGGEVLELDQGADWPWIDVYGTSAAAPFWAGMAADVDMTCNDGTIGDAAAGLDSLYGTYGSSLYGSLLTDVTAISGATSSEDGYLASTGWDPVTGLGTPDAAGLVCPQITSINHPAAQAGSTVTVSGSNLGFASFFFGAEPATIASQSSASATLVVPSGGGNVEVTASLLGTGTGVAFAYEATPQITSATSATFTALEPGSFTVTSTGSPTPAFSEIGALPEGVSFTDNGDGTATISGTPASGSEGSWPIEVTASNGIGTQASQNLALSVDPQSQSVSFTTPPPAGALVGGTATVGATASSGLPVGIASLTLATCTVGGSTVSFVGAGTCTLDAVQGGDTDIAAASAQQSFAVATPPVVTTPTTTTSLGTVETNPQTRARTPRITISIRTSGSSTSVTGVVPKSDVHEKKAGGKVTSLTATLATGGKRVVLSLVKRRGKWGGTVAVVSGTTLRRTYTETRVLGLTRTSVSGTADAVVSKVVDKARTRRTYVLHWVVRF